MDEREELPGGWWLSFIDPSQEVGHRFLGATIVTGPFSNVAEAIMRSWTLKINPGGEVLGCPITQEGIDLHVPLDMRDRFLTYEEMAKNWEMVSWDRFTEDEYECDCDTS